MLANLFQIEMLQTTVSRIMKKNQDEHDFRLGHGGVTVIFAFCCRLKRIFCHHGIKKLAELICPIQNNSITLLSVIIAII